MRKYSMLTTLLMSAGIIMHAQKVKVSWGQESKQELEYGSLVKGDGNEMIKLGFETEGGGMFSKKTVKPILASYDNRLQEKNVKSFLVNEDGIKFDNLLSVKGNLFLFTNRYEKSEKSTGYFVQKIDAKTLNPIGTTNKLGTMQAISRTSQSSVNYEISKDSSKVMMFGLSPYSKKGNEKYYMAVYDHQMVKLWENTVELPYIDKYIDVLDYVVSNDGNVGVIIKHYDKEIRKERVREDGANVPAYKAKFLLYTKGMAKPKEFILNLKDKYVHSLQLAADKEGNLTMFGLYKEKYDGYVTGYFITTVNQENNKVDVSKMEAFPEDLLVLVKKDKQGSDRENSSGLSASFSLADVLDREDGSIDYLLEYQKMVWRTVTTRSGSYSYPVYYYGDIIDIKVNGKTPTQFVRLPKWQQTSYTSLYSGFKAVSVNNKLFVFYNDDKDNVERDLSKRPDDMVKFSKSVLAVGVIDQKGNLNRQIVYDHDDMKLTTCINVSQKLGKGKIGLYAKKGGGVFSASKDMVGVLEVN